MPITDAQLNQISGTLKALALQIDTWLGAGIDPVTLKKNALALIAARSTGQSGLGDAETKFGGDGGVVKGYRALKRDDNIDLANNGTILGVILFDAPGSNPAFYTHDGTTGRQDFTRWLVKQPGGMAEIEILTSKGWVNCVNGVVNVEVGLTGGTPTPAGV